MRRHELEHLIRAAATVTDQYEMVIIGSQSILGAVPNAPASLLQSMEADMYPLNHPELADMIDGAIGELSKFQQQFGYYAEGVGPRTATLPSGWEGRLVKVQNDNTDLKIGYCLEPHDLAASKLVAGREKDWPFVATLLEHNIVNRMTLQERVESLEIVEQHKVALLSWISRQTGPSGGGIDL
jgi:hypothetical protein